MKITLLLLTIFCSTNVVANYPVLESGGGPKGRVYKYETLEPYVTNSILWDTTDFYKVLNNYTSTDISTDLGNSNLVKMVDPLDYLLGLTGNVQGQLDVNTTNIGLNATAINGKADPDLGNLTPTSINQNLRPDLTNTRALGESSSYWSHLFTHNVFMKDTGGAQTVLLSGGNGGYLEVGTLFGAKLEAFSTISTEQGTLGLGSRTQNANGQTTGGLLLYTGTNSSGNGGTGDITIKTGISTLFPILRGKVDIEATEVDLNSTIVKNGLDPIDPQDLATKNYVDTTEVSGGGGEGFNAFSASDNPDASLGISQWIASSPADFSVVDERFIFVNSVAGLNHNVKSNLLNVEKLEFYGANCEQSFNYIGGGAGYQAFVLDAGGGVFQIFDIPESTSWTKVNFYFTCPTALDIVGDADLSDLQFLIQKGAAAPLGKDITWDNSYLGTSKSIGLAQSPQGNKAGKSASVFGCRIQTNSLATDGCEGVVASTVALAASKIRVVFEVGVFTDDNKLACAINRNHRVENFLGAISTSVGLVNFLNKDKIEFYLGNAAGSPLGAWVTLICIGVK